METMKKPLLLPLKIASEMAENLNVHDEAWTYRLTPHQQKDKSFLYTIDVFDVNGELVGVFNESEDLETKDYEN